MTLEEIKTLCSDDYAPVANADYKDGLRTGKPFDVWWQDRKERWWIQRFDRHGNPIGNQRFDRHGNPIGRVKLNKLNKFSFDEYL